MFKKSFFVLVLLIGIALSISACSPSEPQTIIETVVVVETVEVDGEVKEIETIVTVEVPVEVEVEVEPVDEAELERRKTVIFDIDEGSIADPELWNPFAAGRRVEHGFFQAMIEPLFILNIESPDGEIIPWLGESITSNEDATVWTIKLKEGIKWSDGETLDADDFLFTVEMGMATVDLMSMPAFDNVDSVEKVDDLTLQFTLTETDYRFGYHKFRRDNCFILLHCSPTHLGRTGSHYFY